MINNEDSKEMQFGVGKSRLRSYKAPELHVSCVKLEQSIAASVNPDPGSITPVVTDYGSSSEITSGDITF
ncbi:MAG: hypothetical protein LKI39_05995 [Bacteroides sp.]|jgi:hypothetical protein|nr:hypothetical protein [Bacteroides sp.]